MGTPVKDTKPRHADSRQSGRATYPQSDAYLHDAPRQQVEGQESTPGTGPNPNATGAEWAASRVNTDSSPRFEDASGPGMGQIHSYANDGYPYCGSDELDGDADTGAMPTWAGG